MSLFYPKEILTISYPKLSVEDVISPWIDKPGKQNEGFSKMLGCASSYNKSYLVLVVLLDRFRPVLFGIITGSCWYSAERYQVERESINPKYPVHIEYFMGYRITEKMYMNMKLVSLEGRGFWGKGPRVLLYPWSNYMRTISDRCHYFFSECAVL